MKKLYSILTLMALLLFANVLFANDFTGKEKTTKDETMHEILLKHPNKIESFSELKKVALDAENLFLTLRFVDCETKVLEVNTEFTSFQFTNEKGIKLYDMISEAALDIKDYKKEVTSKIENLEKELILTHHAKCELFKCLDFSVFKQTDEKAKEIANHFPQIMLGEIDPKKMENLTDSIKTSINQTIELIDKGYNLQST